MKDWDWNSSWRTQIRVFLNWNQYHRNCFNVFKSEIFMFLVWHVIWKLNTRHVVTKNITLRVTYYALPILWDDLDSVRRPWKGSNLIGWCGRSFETVGCFADMPQAFRDQMVPELGEISWSSDLRPVGRTVRDQLVSEAGTTWSLSQRSVGPRVKRDHSVLEWGTCWSQCQRTVGPWEGSVAIRLACYIWIFS